MIAPLARLSRGPALAGLLLSVVSTAHAATPAFELPATHQLSAMLIPGHYACVEGTAYGVLGVREDQLAHDTVERDVRKLPRHVQRHHRDRRDLAGVDGVDRESVRGPGRDEQDVGLQRAGDAGDRAAETVPVEMHPGKWSIR